MERDDANMRRPDAERPLWSVLLASAAIALLLSIPSPASAAPVRDAACTRRQAQVNPGICRSDFPSPWNQGQREGGPLPQIAPDFGYAFPPYEYFEVNKDIGVFPSPEAAERGSDPITSVRDGFVYLAAPHGQSSDSGEVVRTQQGYVRREDVRQARPSLLQGIAFYRSPRRTFGWINAGGVCPRRAPSSEAPIADECYARYHVVTIFEEEQSPEGRWLRIGAESWVLDERVGLVYPNSERPEGVEGNSWVHVDLAEQTVSVYEDGRLVYATIASTGRYGFWTQPGTFQVWAKLERDNMTGGEPGGDSYYYLEDVPWVLYFDQARALHGTYWHNRFGAPTSRGCVNLSPADARWIFEFASEGSWVHVVDPSGETPTDPSLYGAGGA